MGQLNYTTEEINIKLSQIDLIKSNTPLSDTSKIWYNTNDDFIYFYDGSDWVSVQIFETMFNDQGTTPNNTFFRCGNTVTNDLGVGANLSFDCKVVGLVFNRAPNTTKIGNFWLYSNRDTGTNNASVIASFAVNTDARGFLLPNVETNINEGNYISMRWNGNQTNNNIVKLQYRKKYS